MEKLGWRIKRQACVVAVFSCVMLMGVQAWAANPPLPFPGTPAGFTTVVTDVSGDMINGGDGNDDIISVGYAEDATNVYFRIEVLSPAVNYTNKRYQVYLDTNNDGVNEWLLATPNSVNCFLYRWDVPTSAWVDTGSATSYGDDPDWTPDTTIRIGVAKAELGALIDPRMSAGANGPRT